MRPPKHCRTNDPALNPDDEELEREHFRRIVNAFKYYRRHTLQRITRSELYLAKLPEHHQKLLSHYSDNLSKLKVAVDHNYEIIKLIIQDVAHMFENMDHAQITQSIAKKAIIPSNMDMEKIQSTLKQLVRDWSEDGRPERDTCYTPIIDELDLRFPENDCDRSNISVLVPGAGLGRLAFEIAKRGFICQGNEFSLFMLFTSNFILNKCQGVNLLRIYPWIHQFCNNKCAEDQSRSVTFPDVNPSNLPPNSQFSMAAGDFLEVYTMPESWDCIATCFFIDTANNVVAYIETIWNILKPGGYWINLGPLLYHFADLPNENSIEPSYEDINGIIKEMGFHILKEDKNVPTSYSQNPRSMLRYEYDSVYFVCQKPEKTNNHVTVPLTEAR